MGLKENVRIVTTKKGYETIEEFVKQKLNTNQYKGIVNALEHLAVKEETNKHIIFGWDYIQYHSHFARYELIGMALKKLEKENIPYSFSYCRAEYIEVNGYTFGVSNNKPLPIPTVSNEFDDKSVVNDLKHLEGQIKELDNEMEEEI